MEQNSQKQCYASTLFPDHSLEACDLTQIEAGETCCNVVQMSFSLRWVTFITLLSCSTRLPLASIQFISRHSSVFYSEINFRHRRLCHWYPLEVNIIFVCLRCIRTLWTLRMTSAAKKILRSYSIQKTSSCASLIRYEKCGIRFLCILRFLC